MKDSQQSAPKKAWPTFHLEHFIAGKVIYPGVSNPNKQNSAPCLIFSQGVLSWSYSSWSNLRFGLYGIPTVKSTDADLPQSMLKIWFLGETP
jgi:hypothetical protein